MKKLPYIEDYIELMGDYPLSWPPKDPIISLARYDTPIVESMAGQIAAGNGFTDRQAVLAHKIVVKYKRQWANCGYSVEHLENQPKYRLPIRIIDRVRSIDINNGKIEIRFPYDQSLISEIRASITTIAGSCVFDRDNRCWVTGLIEPRLIWAKEFGAKYNFEFGTNFDAALQAMLGQTDYAIVLRPTTTGFEIANAADTLIDYISQHGGFGRDNILRLIDLSGLLCYEVDDKIYQSFDFEPSVELISMMTKRDTNLLFDNNDIDIGPVVEYARLTHRWPIYVYESGSTLLKKQLAKYFTADEILDRKSNPEASVNKPVVYFNQWRHMESCIPLLLTTHTLMIGNRRQQMLQLSEKIVYFSQRPQDA